MEADSDIISAIFRHGKCFVYFQLMLHGRTILNFPTSLLIGLLVVLLGVFLVESSSTRKAWTITHSSILFLSHVADTTFSSYYNQARVLLIGYKSVYLSTRFFGLLQTGHPLSPRIHLGIFATSSAF